VKYSTIRIKGDLREQHIYYIILAPNLGEAILGPYEIASIRQHLMSK
jgi:hypothetical protein